MASMMILMREMVSGGQPGGDGAKVGCAGACVGLATTGGRGGAILGVKLEASTKVLKIRSGTASILPNF
jgi:hypothetical protein